MDLLTQKIPITPELIWSAFGFIYIVSGFFGSYVTWRIFHNAEKAGGIEARNNE